MTYGSPPTVDLSLSHPSRGPSGSVGAETPDLASSTDDYARRFSGGVGRHMLQVQWELVRRCLPPSPCRVLDLGGGHAQLACPLVEAGFEVTVLGSDGTCRQLLDRRLNAGQFTFCEGNLLDLPWSSGAFDVVLGFRMLAHLTNWPQFLAEACRVAKTSVIIDYPERCSVNWLGDALFGWKKQIEKNTRPYHCYRQQELMEVFEKHGFRHAFSRGQYVLPMALHRAVGSVLFSQWSELAAASVGLHRWIGSPVVLHAVRR